MIEIVVVVTLSFLIGLIIGFVINPYRECKKIRKLKCEVLDLQREIDQWTALDVTDGFDSSICQTPWKEGIQHDS